MSMGDLEKISIKRKRRHNIQKIVLGTIKGAGLLSVALVAPNALKMLEVVDPSFKKRKRNPKYTISGAIDRLLAKNLIRFEKNERGTFIRLTKEGERILRSLELENIHKHQRKKKWDKKWRMIIFDIKEDKKALRDKVRNTLIRIGFLKLQNSVWVYPYDCEDLITMLKVDFKIGKDVLYVIADQIENDAIIKKHFGL